MEDPKPYKPKIRLLKPQDDGARLGTRPKPVGGLMRKRQLRQRTEAQNDALLNELEEHKGAVARLKGILEGIVRTHGEQVLDMDFLNESCLEGRIELEGKPPNFLVVKLLAVKEAPAPEPAPQFPPTDDPFVADLTPVARIAYEAAYAKAIKEQDTSIRLK